MFQVFVSLILILAAMYLLCGVVFAFFLSSGDYKR